MIARLCFTMCVILIIIVLAYKGRGFRRRVPAGTPLKSQSAYAFSPSKVKSR